MCKLLKFFSKKEVIEKNYIFPIDILEKILEMSIEDENYEIAAIIRDEIEKIKNNNND